MNPYEELANAIVVLAAKDYRRAIKQLKRNSKYTPAQQQKSEVERFFRSDWCRELTSVDGEFLIEKSQQEV
ncbi:hypothetical protein EAL2_808p01590 (plasmid) [Peptoclostridium acidaminophilum DSM 3953]|uniref:Uncharacterized protein n=1 Tax=Peptoclostridium acidaminophilum DSM 3953 TaxID=1286171 RepID=W8T7I0_PEPAC|nr:hypothetical protein [Peptoclostridium acidaminophilum]AHM57664.1 hypothetical protein EAL2_808p01590 [Peptoclostridium acidaminophilum DSM 3953]